MSVQNLQETQNFGEWYDKINELINKINSLENGEADINDILREAQELGQIGRLLPAVKSRDYNAYTHNAVAYIDEKGTNGPVDGTAFNLYSAASQTGRVTHLALSTEFGDVKLYLRSKMGTTANWLPWTRLMTKQEADDTFYLKTGGFINGPVEIGDTLTVNGISKFDSESRYYDNVRLCGEQYGAVLQITDKETLLQVTYQNDVLGLPTLHKPIVIDNYTGIADINGTSEYANYLHDIGMTHDFDNASSILAASGLALSKLHDKLVNGYMPLTGGEFTGIVQHSADITFGWTNRDGYNVPITVYSPTEIIFRPTNSMCMVSHDSGADFYIDRDNEPVLPDIPSTFCARTRTGVTNHNPGNVVYELGAVEITEDSVSLRIRKRNVTEDNPVDEKKNMAVFFTRDAIYPTEDATISLGTSSARFNQIFASTSEISTSDINLKTDIEDIDTDLLDNWKYIQWKAFRFKDSVQKKGENARIHTGLIAQDVMKAVDSVNISDYGFFCHDEWDEQTDTDYVTIPEKISKTGKVLRKAKKKEVTRIIREAGEQYSLRYQEVQAIENAYLRREIDKLKKEIHSLKALLDLHD